MQNKESRYRKGEPKLLAMREADNLGGVVVDPIPVTLGERLTVLYHGLLAQSGADQVWLHTGFGDAHRWQDLYDHRMERTERGWVKVFPVEKGSRLNFCFKDSASNWDNNNGLNWSMEIHNGEKQA